MYEIGIELWGEDLEQMRKEIRYPSDSDNMRIILILHNILTRIYSLILSFFSFSPRLILCSTDR